MECRRIILVWITLNPLYCFTSALLDAAFNETCTQSSTHYGRVAARAVDVIIDNSQIGLGRTVVAGGSSRGLLDSVRPVSERLNNFTVRVLLDMDSQGAVCTYYEGAMPSAAVETLQCHHNLLGRFVKISKPSPILTLCEVQVLVVEEPKVVFERQMKKTIDDNPNAEVVVSDAPSCAEYCKRSLGCCAFGYNQTTGTCRQYISTVTSITASDELIFYIRRN